MSCKLQGRASIAFNKLKETYIAANWVPDIIIQNVLFGTRRQLWLGSWQLECKETGLGVRLEVKKQKRERCLFLTFLFFDRLMRSIPTLDGFLQSR